MAGILERYANPQDQRMMFGSFIKAQKENQKIQVTVGTDIRFTGTVLEFIDSAREDFRAREIAVDLVRRYVLSDHMESDNLLVIELGERSDDDEYPRNTMELCHQSFALTSSDLKDEVKLLPLLMMVGKNVSVKILSVDITGKNEHCLTEGFPTKVLADMKVNREYLNDPVKNITVESGVMVILMNYRCW